MNEYLTFEKMITPLIIQIVFWLGVVVTVLGGLTTMFTTSFFYGLMILVLGPLVIRIYCEITIIFFRIHDTLRDIRDSQYSGT